MVELRKEDWERFGRASKEMASELVELYKWRNNPTSFDVSSYYAQILIHRAHTIMLYEEEIISKKDAKQIIKGIKQIEKDSRNDPKLVNYMSTETALIKIIGDAGGKMHIGRSRNDLAHTQRRIYYRDQLNRVISTIIEYKKKIIDASYVNVNTIMPGYTHWRQAQPITLGHYLMAHVEAASRTIKRLEDIYRRTNLSPLGSAAFAGTYWPVNRERTMELLGFDDLIVNTLDAVASMDYYMEFASAIAIHMSNMSRLAEDIQIWSSDEFKFLDLDEGYVGTSSIMPQKKNPIILEQVRSYASESIGEMTKIYSSMKGMPYTNTSDRAMLEPLILDTIVGSTNAIAGLIFTLKPMEENMMMKLKEGFSTMTDLADTLVKLHNISFRQAHDIIANVTIDAINKGIIAENITLDMISKASKIVMDTEITVPLEDLKQAIKPELNIQRRRGIGMPSPESVKAMIKTQKAMINDEEKRLDARLGKLDKAKHKLIEAENNL